MALRILSGMIFIPNGGTAEGSVEVSFNPFQISASSNPAFELRKETEKTARAFRSPSLLDRSGTTVRYRADRQRLAG